MDRPDDIPPYNYCDYRCEECEYRDSCKVYEKDHERRMMHELKGEDPDDMKIVLEDVEADFKEAMEMLRMQADEMGIDLDEISDEDYKPPPDPKVFPLYRQSYEFTLRAHAFLKTLDEIRHAQPDLKEEIGNLSWHHTVISAKLARALLSKWEGGEFDLQDAELSAQVALRSLNFCNNALKTLLNEVPDRLNEILELLSMTNQIREGIEAEFSSEDSSSQR